MITMDIPYPKLYDGNTLAYIGNVHPLHTSVDLSITPLSTASIQLPEDETLPARSYVEMYTSMGSAGLFRVRSPESSYGDDLSTSELEHAIVEVGDWLVLNKYDQMMPAAQAMATVFSHYRGNKWTYGDFGPLGTQEIALQADHITVLEAMLSILEQVPDCMMVFNFSVRPWVVGIAKRGTAVTAEGRLSRNLQSARINRDDSSLCTRAYYEQPTTDAQGSASSEWKTLDADTIGTWGVIEREVPTGGAFTPEQALLAAQEYLRKNKNPKISVEISAQELSSITGETFDRFEIGKLFRLALPDHNIILEQVITALTWDDVYGSPLNFTVTLAEEEDSTITFLHELVSTGGSTSAGGSGGGGGKRKQDDKWKEYRTHFDRTDQHIFLTAEKVDRAGNILEQAGMKLDSHGVLIYAEDNENNLSSKIKVQADRISLVVEGTGRNAKIKPASIVASINGSESNIKISADHIELDGHTIASYLTAQTLEVSALDVTNGIECGAIDAAKIDCTGVNTNGGDVSCGAVDCDSLKIDGDNATWRSFTHHTFSVSTSRPFMYGSTSGASGTVTGYILISHSTNTINYLGRKPT